MADREKVIKGLECCNQINQTECFKCPYARGNGCTHALMGDVLALLKEQKPVRPESIMYTSAGIGIAYCPRCNRRIDEYHNNKFCGDCGQVVKWDD